MNRDSNSYTIIYAIVMVVLVAVGLAFTAEVLKSRQDKNVQIDKMQQILGSVGIYEKDMSKVEATYQQYIKEELLVMPNGSVKETFSGDQIAKNAAFEMNTANQFKYINFEHKDLPLPIFVADIDGAKKYIFPMNGAGLWGPIWGYIAVDADGNTVYGTDFSHQGETPGLGAEITTPKFKDQFPGKTLFHNGKFESIAVVKGNKAPANGQSYVDGISGGTLTSNGVNNMLFNSLKPYEKYLEGLRAASHNNSANDNK